MATGLKTPRKKALRGIIRDIQHNCTMSFISAEVEEEGLTLTSEMSKQELNRLNLKTGDRVEIFPVKIDTYLIIGKPSDTAN